MRIAFSEHALDKLEDRELSKEQVKEIVRKPDEVVSGKFGRLIAHKLVGNEMVRVVYIKSPGDKP